MVSTSRCLRYVTFWVAIAVASGAGSTLAYAQCNDGNTTHIGVSSLLRTGGNAVQFEVGTETVGDFAADYQNYVDFTESNGSTVINTNSGTWSSQGSEIEYTLTDQPSVYGAGTYSVTSDHKAYADCYGTSVDPANPVTGSLVVNTPTITGFISSNGGFWNLGPGTNDPQETIGGAYFYPLLSKLTE